MIFQNGDVLGTKEVKEGCKRIPTTTWPALFREDPFSPKRDPPMEAFHVPLRVPSQTGPLELCRIPSDTVAEASSPCPFANMKFELINALGETRNPRSTK